MERSYHILIIDPEANNRERYSSYFREHGLTVETASDGIAGFERLQRGSFDVVILDIRLPNMDGLQVIHRMKALGLDTSVIIISDHGLREDAIQALNAGVDYWFDKANIDLEHLLEKTLDLAQVLPSAEITRILSAIPDHD